MIQHQEKSGWVGSERVDYDIRITRIFNRRLADALNADLVIIASSPGS